MNRTRIIRDHIYNDEGTKIISWQEKGIRVSGVSPDVSVSYFYEVREVVYLDFVRITEIPADLNECKCEIRGCELEARGTGWYQSSPHLTSRARVRS